MKTCVFLLFFGVLACGAMAQPGGLTKIDTLPPKPINLEEVKRMIGYPPGAVEKQIQGDVWLILLVDTNGTVSRHRVLYSGHPDFLNAVESQLHHLKFVPATGHGQPFKCNVTVPFSFRLNQVGNSRYASPEEEPITYFDQDTIARIPNPFGEQYAQVIAALRKISKDGDLPLAGQAFLKMQFDANCKLEGKYFERVSSAELREAIFAQLKHLQITPESKLCEKGVGFSLFVPFTVR